MRNIRTELEHIQTNRDSILQSIDSISSYEKDLITRKINEIDAKIHTFCTLLQENPLPSEPQQLRLDHMIIGLQNRIEFCQEIIKKHNQGPSKLDPELLLALGLSPSGMHIQY